MDIFKNKNLEIFKRKAFELCLAIWRVTKLFPEAEFLAKELRRMSCEIIVALARGEIRDTILKAEELNIYLAIAREQNWVKPINFDLLKSEYAVLKESLLRLREGSEKQEQKKENDAFLSEQKKIITEKENLNSRELIFGQAEKRRKLAFDYFRKNKEGKISDLLEFIGGVSERTLRNDLAYLASRHLIKKIGQNKGARYVII